MEIFKYRNLHIYLMRNLKLERVIIAVKIKKFIFNLKK